MIHRTVSRPPEARRKVLGSSHGPSSSSSPTASASFASPRPLRARVDLDNRSPQASLVSIWTPTQPVRARVQLPSAASGHVRGGAFTTSAPTTPSTSGSPFARASAAGTSGAATPSSALQSVPRATLSPRTPTASSGRAPSPIRARSPDAASARPTVARASTAARYVQSDLTPEAKLLRGQSDPFPTASPTSTATPITYLPSSVSVRRLPSPRARASSALGVSTSTTSSVDSSAVPALSTSPSSTASSPLASPYLGPDSFDTSSTHTGLSPVPNAFYDGSVGRKGGPYARRLSGTSSVSTASSHNDGGLLAPVTIDGDERISSISPVPVLSPFPQSPPLRSPSLQAFPTQTAAMPGTVRSPTMSSFSSLRTVRNVPSAGSSVSRVSRPPSTASNPTTASRMHARSHSTTSTTSLSSAFLPSEEREHAASLEPLVPPGWGNGQHRPGATAFGTSVRNQPSARSNAPGGMDWSAVVQLAELELDADHHQLVSGVSTGRTSSGSEGPLPPTDAVMGMNRSAESRGAEVDEAEKEARVARKIADLEIRNTSLLAINASLERMKVKHTAEIRELRRRMRESIGGAGLAALRAQASRLDNNDLAGGAGPSDLLSDSDADRTEEGGLMEDAGEDEEPEPTWQELLEGDATFSALAATVESLIARGQRAVAYEPSKGETGRVLSTVEMEDRFRRGCDGDEAAEDEEDEEVTPDSSGRSTPATASTRSSGKGLGIVGWQSGRS